MNFLSKLPTSAMVVLGLMGLMGPIVFLGASQNPRMMWVWSLMYVVLAALAGLGAYVYERKQKEKADSFTKGLSANAASTEGLRDQDQMARADQLRREFQRGIDVYQQYGKDIYSLPWYVVVGESGSGKTEAIRRSEIGFPDKLQDRWQGVGGTLSMHWWFSNRAVILDTAGRLFVKDGDDPRESSAAESQWSNFLQMLRKHRTDCPINGLVLVIPATTLLPAPDAEQELAATARLDSVAGQISRQLEVLQRELGVRFPVYVLISKTDRIPGFREYFANIEGTERYQMFGWSNPAPLDQTFHVEDVTAYLATVADRLRRRLLTSLRNPEPADRSGVRFDEVDTTYAFPTAFGSLAAKLERYLRHIFSSGEWAAKPPFLRGIFFTSALQQGQVLDAAIAQALGKSMREMESDQGGDVMQMSKHRAYFLRDFFLEKVFLEKGLVTRSMKTSKVISGWKIWIPASLGTAALLLGLLAWWTWPKKATELGRWKHLTQRLSSGEGEVLRGVIGDPSAEEGEGLTEWPEEARTILAELGELGMDVQRKPKVSWIFWPRQMFDRDLDRRRKQTYRWVVRSVTADLAERVADKLEKQPVETWGEDNDRALRALCFLAWGKAEVVKGKDGKPLRLLVAPHSGDAGDDAALKGSELLRDLAKPLFGEGSSWQKPLDSVEGALASAHRLPGEATPPLADAGVVRQLVEKRFFKEGDPKRWNRFVEAVKGFDTGFKKFTAKIAVPAPGPEAAGLAAETIAAAEALLRDHGAEFAVAGRDAGGGDKSGESEQPSDDCLDAIKEGFGGVLGDLFGDDSDRKELSKDLKGRWCKDEGAPLRAVLEALRPGGEDGRFTPEEAGALLRQAMNKPASEGDKGTIDTARLRGWWAREFLGKGLGDHLSFPLVRHEGVGAPPVPDDQRLTLCLRLVKALDLLVTKENQPKAFRTLCSICDAVTDMVQLSPDKPWEARKYDLKLVDSCSNPMVLKLRIDTKMVSFDNLQTNPLGGASPTVTLRSSVQSVINVSGTDYPIDPNPVSWAPLSWLFDGSQRNPQGFVVKRFVLSRDASVWMRLMLEAGGLPPADEWPKAGDFKVNP